jgi:prophage maintenance system killer protein
LVWYPSVDDVIDMNINALELSRDKHPHKMLGSVERIQAILERIREVEGNGLTHQAALIMKEFANAQIFAGANHRTAYGLAKMFLRRNGKRLRVDDFKNAYPFIKNVGAKNIQEIQEWIEHGASEESE